MSLGRRNETLKFWDLDKLKEFIATLTESEVEALRLLRLGSVDGEFFASKLTAIAEKSAMLGFESLHRVQRGRFWIRNDVYSEIVRDVLYDNP